MNEYSFEQLSIGTQESQTLTLTKNDIEQFASFSGDYSTIHMDDKYAESRSFKARLTHGMLVGSYISSLLGMKLPGKHGLLQSINCNFCAPCYAPNTLIMTGTVKRRSEGLKVVTIEITVVDQDGTLIVKAMANTVLKL